MTKPHYKSTPRDETSYSRMTRYALLPSEQKQLEDTAVRERRSLTNMVTILLSEALERRRRSLKKE